MRTFFISQYRILSDIRLHVNESVAHSHRRRFVSVSRAKIPVKCRRSGSLAGKMLLQFLRAISPCAPECGFRLEMHPLRENKLRFAADPCKMTHYRI
jgi:hypothetical protein